MTNYDSADSFAKTARSFQFFQERLGAKGAFFRVVFRVVRAKRGGRLSPVTKQDSKTQGGHGRRAVQNVRCVLEDAAGAFPEIQRLRCHGARSLDYDVEDIVVFHKDGGSAGRAQKRAQLGENSFFRQRLQKRSILADCVFRSMLDGKSQFRGEAETPHDTKRVFGKAVEGVADCAKTAFSDVVKSSERVKNAAGRMEGHGVDAEITPREVVFYGVGEHYGVGMSRIAVGSVDAVGCYLEGKGFDQDGHRSVLRSRFHDVVAGLLEEGACFLPRRRSGYVVIVGLDSHERVANAPTDEPGAIAGLFELVQDVERSRIDRYVGGKIHGRNGSGKRGEKQQGITGG